MQGYKKLGLEKREKIYLLQNNSVKSSEIAIILGHHKSTISRKLGRFKSEELGYLLDKAHQQYKSKLFRNKGLFSCVKLQELVVLKLIKDRWSPEQISGRLKQQKSAIYVCTETIINLSTAQ